eukprot:498272-Alexandrium_andersonii.AAC.1
MPWIKYAYTNKGHTVPRQQCGISPYTICGGLLAAPSANVGHRIAVLAIHKSARACCRGLSLIHI